ncbi:MAG: 3-deoxy-8-phosphooctulonate synthase [Limisphaerales bacterium]
MGAITWGLADQWVLFAGPDIFEDEGLVLEVASELQRTTRDLGIPWVLKCSFDKANRQSLSSFRGPGVDQALAGLRRIKTRLDCPLVVDVHDITQVDRAAEIADVLQIPAFLCRQTDLIVAAAKSGRVLNIKKGQFMAPWDMGPLVEKARSTGNGKILLCERGTSFGYNRLVNDFTGLVQMRETGCPVIMDATHSVQVPGGGVSGGRRDMIEVLARAACAVGVDGLFLETHPRPDEALCDGPNSLELARIPALLRDLQSIWKALA